MLGVVVGNSTIHRVLVLRVLSSSHEIFALWSTTGRMFLNDLHFDNRLVLGNWFHD